MIYRILTKVGLVNRLNCEKVNPIKAPLGQRTLLPSVFEKKFELIEETSDWPFCKVYRAPLMAGYHIQNNLVVNMQSGDIPDVWTFGKTTIVSEGFRAVLDQVDEFNHQYCPITIIDKAGNDVTKKQFFCLSIRRFVRIENLSSKCPLIEFDFAYGEIEYLPTIIAKPDLRENLEKLPIWRNEKNKQTLYMNEILFKKCVEKNITGLDFYTSPYGDNEEAVAHV